MKPTQVGAKVSTATVQNSSPLPTTIPPTSVSPSDKSRIKHTWDIGWDMLSKAATIIVIIWGGQGIYDRNFPRSPSKEENKAIINKDDEIKSLGDKVKVLENKIKELQK